MSHLRRSVDSMTPITAAVLAFEGKHWNRSGSKEQAIRDVFGVSATRYYQALLRIVDDPDALRFDPVLVNRLRRRRVA